MRIEFCSLCDESVPLPDLDKGIAVKTKGRIICANCESAMSTEAPAKPTASLEFMGAAPGLGMPLASGGDTTVMEVSRAPGRGRRPRPGPEGLLGGMLFAAFTLLVIGAVAAGFHFYDQYEMERDAAGKELKRLSQVQNQNAANQDRRVRAAVLSATEQLPATILEVRKLRADMASLDSTRSGELARLRSDLDLVKQKLVQVDVLVERLEGNQADLGKVAASLADVFDEVLALSRRLDSVQAIASTLPQAASDPAQLALAKPAPWLDQVSGLEDPDPGSRWLAVTALGEFQDPQCGPYLVPRLKDEDVFVRMAAARILGEIKATSAIEPLIDTLEDEQNTVRQAAMLALRSLTGVSHNFDADEKPALRAKRVKAWRDWWKKNQSEYEEA